MNKNFGLPLITLSVVVALLISVSFHSISLLIDSSWLLLLPHELVTLVVFFWVMVQPHRMSFILVWFLGLLLDVLYYYPLGLNGVCLASIVYIGQQIHDAYVEENETRMLLLLLLMFIVVSSVKISLITVSLDLEFSMTQLITIPISLFYALLLVPLRTYLLNK